MISGVKWEPFRSTRTNTKMHFPAVKKYLSIFPAYVHFIHPSTRRYGGLQTSPGGKRINTRLKASLFCDMLRTMQCVVNLSFLSIRLVHYPENALFRHVHVLVASTMYNSICARREFSFFLYILSNYACCSQIDTIIYKAIQFVRVAE